MSLHHIIGILVALIVVAAVIFTLSDLLPRWRSKKRHERHLDQLFQFDHLRSDKDSDG